MSSSKEECGNSNNIAKAPEASNAAADASRIANAPEASNAAAADASRNGNLANLAKECPFQIQNVSGQTFGVPFANALLDRLCKREVAYPNSPACVITLENNIRILSVPSSLIQVVLLEPPASLTLHGSVKVTVSLGRVCIFGYEVKEGEMIKVFSTEGTGLKKIVALNSVRGSTIEVLKSKLDKILLDENIDIEEFMNSIQPNTVVFTVEKAIFSAPLRVLELYYPNALRAKLPNDKKIKREEKFELCSTEESYAIDISDDFKMLSEEVNQMISQPVSDEGFGPRILVVGEKKLGKSTLIQYLMNSSLNKRPMFYFLDTDLDQAECTPPGVISLYRVTKPLLGPPFVHQQKPLQMIFVGSISPVTFPQLYERSVVCMMRFFNSYFRKETLFVNTMGWRHGILDICLQSVRVAVKPTVVITLVPPDPNLSLKKDVAEVTNFVVPSKVPSRESDAPSFSDMEMRNFKVLAYLGQCQRPYLPLTPINAFEVFKMKLNRVALHVMGKKVPPNHLVKTIPCSMVALCHVHSSCLVKSNNPELPKTLCDDLVHECLGFGFVKGTDETKNFFEIITPLARNQLNKVNALITGQIAIPAAIFIKQAPITNVPIPVRTYIEQFIPLILEGVLKITFVRPEDPVQYLADWILTFKDAYYNRLMNGFFS